MAARRWDGGIAPGCGLRQFAAMSIYRKSWLFMVWTLLVFVSFPLWIGLLLASLGEAGFVIAMAFWLSHGLAMMFVFRCPNCGRSLFMRGYFINVPWPAKDCSKCGADLTIEPKSD